MVPEVPENLAVEIIVSTNVETLPKEKREAKTSANEERESKRKCYRQLRLEANTDSWGAGCKFVINKIPKQKSLHVMRP